MYDIYDIFPANFYGQRTFISKRKSGGTFFKSWNLQLIGKYVFTSISLQTLP